tara:strand:- start:1644 stop:2174 length:531 start_codon:yes stop_codon:yes gene_type:complete
MKDNLLNEELSIMKSLFTHQRGVVISEQENVTQPDELNKVLAPIGIELTPEESEEAHQECPIDMPSDEKEAGFVKQILNNLKGMSIPELVKELKGVLRIKDKPIKEQSGALAVVMIAGIAVPTFIAVGIAAIIVISIITTIVSKLKNRGKRPKRSSCGKRRKLLRKFGMSGNFIKL